MTATLPFPTAGDMVLFTMPADWRPDLGIRTYPAVVLYQTGNGCLDVQAFTGLDEMLRYGWAQEGSEPGQWRRRG